MVYLRFDVNQDFINPSFQAYKLSTTHNIRVETKILPWSIHANKVNPTRQLSFRQIQARVHHNHLTTTDDRVFYIANDYKVIELIYDSDKDDFIIHSIITLPEPKSNSSLNTIVEEYPTIVSASKDLLLASDGIGYIHLIKLNDPTEIIYSAQIDQPCLLLAAKKTHQDTVLCLFTYTISTKPIKDTKFNLTLACISSNGLEIIHSLCIGDIPAIACISPDSKGYLIASDTLVKLPENEVEKKEFPTQDMEITMNNSQSQSIDEISTSPSPSPSPSPPYMWMQTNEDVTMHIHLPFGTKTSTINCTLTNSSLSLLVKIESQSTKQNNIPCYITEHLYDKIDSSTSLWTYDSEKSILSIHMEKQIQNGTSRWPHIFKNDDGVLETLDPSELQSFLDRLNQYTSNIQDVIERDNSGYKPSSLQNEIDENIDLNVGRPLIFTYITTSQLPKILLQGHDPTDIIPKSAMPIHNNLVSRSLYNDTLSFKHDVDSLVYHLDLTSKNNLLNHITSIPAFAFVLASKREAKFPIHILDGKKMVAIVIEGSGRFMYVYWPPEDTTRGQQTFGKQAIISLKDHQDSENELSDNVIGVGAVGDRANPIILIATKTSLIVVRNLLDRP